MQKWLVPCIFLFFALGMNAQNSIEKCHTMENDALRRAKFPALGTLEDNERLMAPLIKAYQERRAEKSIASVVTLPIIFHVIHNGEAVGSGTNISTALINAQIEQLNNDFRKIMGTSGYNTNPVGADSEIEFCAALVDPNGNVLAAPGIERINRNDRGWVGGAYGESYIDGTIKPQTYWDPTRYVNVWVLELTASLLGYATFPSMSTLTAVAAEDGVVIQYYSVGSSAMPSSATPYNEGRTLTHELGHFFNLYHTFQGGCSSSNDLCDDTPRVSSPTFGCPVGRTTCSGTPTMIENYMDYSDDGCMNIFTLDQKARMQACIMNFPRRMELPNSTACTIAVACTSCPATTILLSNNPGCNDQGTCLPTDDVYTFSVTVTHQECAEITGDGKFTLKVDPSGSNYTFGPFDYASGTTTTVNISVPYGLSAGTSVILSDSDFPCTVNGSLPVATNGCSNYTGPSITCPSTHVSCPGITTAPNITGTPSAHDCDGNSLSVSYTDMEVGVGLSPGESVIERTWTSAPDGLGNTASCVQTIRREDTEPPMIAMPPSPVTVYSNSVCGYNASPTVTGTPSVSDNCVNGLVATYTDETMPGTCSGNLIITRTWKADDGYGNMATVYQTINVIDNTAPNYSTAPSNGSAPCGDMASFNQWLANNGNAAAADNCSAITWATPVQTGTTQGCGNTICYTYEFRVKDACNNSNPASATFCFVDNEGPTLVCRTNTVHLNSSGIYILQVGDVLNTAASYDNCGGYMVTSISPAQVTCDQVGTVVAIMVTATDDCNNTSSCTANITVLKSLTLPPPFVNNEVGTSGQVSGTATYDPCEQIFTVTSSGFSTNLADDAHFVYQTLCGNSSITAHVLDAQNGWGGIMMRESLAAGAKKVGLKVDYAPSGSNSLIREIRMVTNGVEQQQSFPIPPGHTWLRLTRSGSIFQGLTSPDGVNWTIRFSVSLSMGNCLLTGLFTEAYNVNTVASADFSSVTVLGSGPVVPLAGTGVGGAEATTDVWLYPNPTNGIITADIRSFMDQKVEIKVFNTLGQPVWSKTIEAVIESGEKIDLSDQNAGVYWVVFLANDGQKIIRRIVLTK